MGFNVNSQPGINASQSTFGDYTVNSINIFYQKGEYATFMAAPVSISGNSTDQPSNTPYDFVILPGQLFGLITTGSQAAKYGSSVIGLTTLATANGATTIQTDSPTATELVRRIGTSGSFTLTGPPAASGAVSSNTITYSNANVTTGVITVTATTAPYIATSLIQPVDGSQQIRTVYGKQYPFKVKDIYNVIRTDITCDGLVAASGGAIIEDAWIMTFGTTQISDPSLMNWIKGQLGAALPGTNFRSNQNT